VVDSPRPKRKATKDPLPNGEHEVEPDGAANDEPEVELDGSAQVEPAGPENDGPATCEPEVELDGSAQVEPANDEPEVEPDGAAQVEPANGDQVGPAGPVEAAAIVPIIPVRDSPAARAAIARATYPVYLSAAEPLAQPAENDESSEEQEDDSGYEEEDPVGWRPTIAESNFQQGLLDESASSARRAPDPRNDSAVPPVVKSAAEVIDVIDSSDEESGGRKAVNRRVTGRGGPKSLSGRAREAMKRDKNFAMNEEFKRQSKSSNQVQYLVLCALAPEMIGIGEGRRMVFSGPQVKALGKLFELIGLNFPNTVRSATWGDANVSVNPKNIMELFYEDNDIDAGSTGRKALLASLLSLPKDPESECTDFISVSDLLSWMAAAGRASNVTSSCTNSLHKILTASIGGSCEDLIYVQGGEGERIDLALVCAPVAEMLQDHLNSGDLSGFKADFLKYCRHPGLKELFTAWDPAVSSEGAAPAKKPRKKTKKAIKKSPFEEDEEEEE
jgi:hypothetical protein